jgi:hypothetical protein
MNTTVSFTKPIPDELYIDSFVNNNTKAWTYTGNNLVYILVDKILGGIQGNYDNMDFNYNPDISQLMTIDATIYPDVAYWATNTDIPDRIFETETLVDGTMYEKITNPTLRDVYSLNYDFQNNKWNWTVVTINPKNNLALKMSHVHSNVGMV